MGKITFYYGAMSSGKTIDLIQTAYKYNSIGLKALVIKPAIDTKGNHKIISRMNNTSRDVDILLKPDDSLANYIEKVKDAYCIIIDEAQFLTETQVKELVILAKQMDIDVICYGLLVDFKGQLFPGSNALCRYSDSKEELKAICIQCGEIARYNARKVNGKYVFHGDQVLIGADESYDPLCMKCFLEKVLLPQDESFQKIMKGWKK